MGIKQEIERLRQRDQIQAQQKEQQKRELTNAVNDRINFLNTSSKDLIKDVVPIILQQSGAIDALNELREATGINDEVRIGATVEYLYRPYRQRSPKKDIKRFGGTNLENLEGGWEREHDTIDELKSEIEVLTSIDPQNSRGFRVTGCFVFLEWDTFETEGRWYGELYKDSGGKKLAICLSKDQKTQKWKMVLSDCSFFSHSGSGGGNDIKRKGKIFSINQDEWGNKSLLRNAIAKAYYEILKQER